MNDDRLYLDPPANRDSATSMAAARRIREAAPVMIRRVLVFIRERGPYGATDEEVQIALGLRVQSETPRRVELVRFGKVTDSGRRRLTTSGRSAVVWIAAESRGTR